MSGDWSGHLSCNIIPSLRHVFAGMRVVSFEPSINVGQFWRLRMTVVVLAHGFCGSCDF
jgi:hypothetical protein